MATKNARRQPKLKKKQATSSAKPKRIRLQLDFSPEAHKHLQDLKPLADTRSNAEVIRRALQLYDWFLKKKQQNVALQLVEDDGTVKLIELL